MQYLTISRRGQVFYEQIVNEAQPSWLSLIDNDGMQVNWGKLTDWLSIMYKPTSRIKYYFKETNS